MWNESNKRYVDSVNCVTSVFMKYPNKKFGICGQLYLRPVLSFAGLSDFHIFLLPTRFPIQAACWIEVGDSCCLRLLGKCHECRIYIVEWVRRFFRREGLQILRLLWPNEPQIHSHKSRKLRPRTASCILDQMERWGRQSFYMPTRFPLRVISCGHLQS